MIRVIRAIRGSLLSFANRVVHPHLVIRDAGPLIHPDELGCVNLFRDFDEVQVPEAVWHEGKMSCHPILNLQIGKNFKVSIVGTTISELRRNRARLRD